MNKISLGRETEPGTHLTLWCYSVNWASPSNCKQQQQQQQQNNNNNNNNRTRSVMSSSLSPDQTDSQANASFRLAFNLPFVWPPTCVHFAMTCVSSSNSYASRRNLFFTAWPPNARRHKLITSHPYVRGITAFWNLRELASRVANPFGHPSQVRAQVLVLQTWVDVCRLASPFDRLALM